MVEEHTHELQLSNHVIVVLSWKTLCEAQPCAREATGHKIKVQAEKKEHKMSAGMRLYIA